EDAPVQRVYAAVALADIVDLQHGHHPPHAAVEACARRASPHPILRAPAAHRLGPDVTSAPPLWTRAGTNVIPIPVRCLRRWRRTTATLDPDHYSDGESAWIRLEADG